MQPGDIRWDAVDYGKHSKVQYQWAQELIAELQLRGCEAVLDIGCGDGKVTKGIAERLPHGYVIGVDRSEDMITFARKRYSKQAFRNLIFRKLDVREWDFESQFDVAFSNAALHWIVDHRPLLYRVKKALRPNGRILFQMGGKGNAAGIISVLDDLLTSKRWKRYFLDFDFPYGFYEERDYGGWLAQVGLVADSIRRIPKEMKHVGREGLAGWFRTTWQPYIARIPAAMRKEFISEVIDGYLKAHPLDQEGKSRVGMIRLQVAAHKPYPDVQST
jgi:trans-aconitate methyltransferase